MKDYVNALHRVIWHSTMTSGDRYSQQKYHKEPLLM